VILGFQGGEAGRPPPTRWCKKEGIMSTSSGTLRMPRRAGTHPVARQVLQVVLVLAISIGAIIVLATLREPAVGVDARMTATGLSDVDARWVPKWRAVAEVATAVQGFIADTRWTSKTARAEAARMRALP
jgi:hypothetical protein